MAGVRSENLKGGYKRETRTYAGGGVKEVTYKPTWYGGRDIKSVERREPKKK